MGIEFASGSKVNDFDKIELLLGIEDGENAQKFLFDPNYTSSFFSNLDKKTLTKILNNDVSIRFTSTGTTIHSKIYILKNLKTKNTRVIFIGTHKQYDKIDATKI